VAILDKLVEKKEIYCYVKARKAFLIQNAKAWILKQEPRKRELLKQRVNGRVRELELLETTLRRNELKKIAIKDWPALYDKGGE